MKRVNVSFIIPMYNKEIYIRETINSIFDSCSHNEFKSFEIIIVDDESTDKSYDKIIDLIDGDRVFYYKQKNSGPSSARNNGVNLARGEYVIFVDADDIILPSFVGFINHVLQQEIHYPVIAVNYSEQTNPSYELALQCKTSQHIDLNNVYYIADLYRAWSIHQFFYTTSICISRKFLLNNNILFPEGYNSGEDQFVWFQLGRLTGILFLDQEAVLYRKGVPNQLSSKLPLNVEIHVRKLLEIEKCNFFSSESISKLIDKNYTYIIVNNFLNKKKTAGLKFIFDRKRILKKPGYLLKIIFSFFSPKMYSYFKRKSFR
ncbi:glycosyltransferase family A protein [Raoultella ornithinolytica]|nr:glycosyltransferase family 2 protein [Raoultella ornithinolytica]ELS5458551.1 glycosyltransferase family 2 protein [Raoultella ornithinolytica]ELS5482088.1 glycosyltransferase family 2 protein [Raoultella ornithinolytica]MDV1387128.1 glycosyltransferase family 2 protein [Raoultella ornithinolytica]HCL6050474.1 glycosyltransferase family 2 protein [Raoultella ornithinolytica]